VRGLPWFSCQIRRRPRRQYSITEAVFKLSRSAVTAASGEAS
jgi:hypothetical protein